MSCYNTKNETALDVLEVECTLLPAIVYWYEFQQPVVEAMSVLRIVATQDVLRIRIVDKSINDDQLFLSCS